MSVLPLKWFLSLSSLLLFCPKSIIFSFCRKKLPKDFASSGKGRTFALAFGKQPGVRFPGAFLCSLLGTRDEIFDRLRTEESQAAHMYIIYNKYMHKRQVIPIEDKNEQ